MENNNARLKTIVPKASASLAFGILSILTCWFYAIPGLIFGISGVILAGVAEKAFQRNENEYHINSVGIYKAARILGIIGTVLSGLAFIIFVFLFFIFGLRTFNLYFHLYNY